MRRRLLRTKRRPAQDSDNKALTASTRSPIQSPKLGRAIDEPPARTVYPDGRGLPPGSGSVADGELVYATYCIACHGPNGQGATADELAGGRMALDSDIPDKVIGTYWPFATTLFDFIKRAMPMQAPKILNDDQVYAVTAYLLHLNGVIDESTVLDESNLAAVQMPNRDGFDWIDAPQDEAKN